MASKLDYPRRHAGLYVSADEIIRTGRGKPVLPRKPTRKTKPAPAPKTKARKR